MSKNIESYILFGLYVYCDFLAMCQQWNEGKCTLLTGILFYLTGMKDGENIRFTGEGDQEPGVEPGDIVIVLDEKPHDVFKRRDLDLVMTLELDLVEALCGFQRTITTLDKRTLIISTMPGLLQRVNYHTHPIEHLGHIENKT